jgi:hypothetical protein
MLFTIRRRSQGKDMHIFRPRLKHKWDSATAPSQPRKIEIITSSLV